MMRAAAATPQNKRSPTKTGQLKRCCNAQIRALEGENNQYELSFSSEEPYFRGWGTEIIDHSPDAPDLSRLNDIGVLLFNHNRDKVVGKVVKAWLDEAEHRCKAIVEFDSDEDSKIIHDKVDSGTLKGVSFCYTWDDWEEVPAGKKSKDGKYTGPAYIVRKWTALEISIVSVPADATVGVGRGMTEEKPSFITESKCSSDDMSLVDAQIQINQNIAL